MLANADFETANEEEIKFLASAVKNVHKSFLKKSELRFVNE
jgi:hypothetical protein